MTELSFGGAATLHPLLFVHRLVGLFEQLFETRHALGFECRDTDTEREFVSTRFRRVVGFEIFVESRDCVFFTGVEVGYENCKLIAAKPRDDVGTSETAIEYRGGIDQRVVAFVMTKLVVDSLHAVEVDKEQQQSLFLPACEVEIRRCLFE